MQEEGEKKVTKVHCCCNINGDTRIRTFLLIMTKLPGRVSGFSPLPCPGTPAASPQRRLPCRDELLTGPKTACLMLCQARHGAAGMLAASWPTPCITGLNPFYPYFPSPLSLSALSFQCLRIVMQSVPGRDVGVLSNTEVSKSYLYNLLSQ